MDESNDKTDKSCIILVGMFDSSVGDSRTRFLDMPIVNVGTAVNLFSALRSSLESKGLDFSNAIADTTIIMRGARSGVQKLIKNGHPHLYNVGCICHLADLTPKVIHYGKHLTIGLFKCKPARLTVSQLQRPLTLPRIV